MHKHMEKCATCVLLYHRESGAAAALLSVACACCPTSSSSSSLSTPTLAMSQARRLNGDMRMCGRSGVELIETLSMAGGPLQDLRIVFEMTVTVRWGHRALVPAEPMLLRWWRWWCFRSCWCQNAPLLSSVLHIPHTSESIAAVLYWVESKWQFVTQKDEGRNERSRLFFFVNATCDIIFKCHCELSQDFKLLRFCLWSIFVECSQVRKMKASNIGRG